MSKVIMEHYECDYCGKEITDENKANAYTDNSGIDSLCYDMCSDECLNMHKQYLKSKGIKYSKHKENITKFFT